MALGRSPQDHALATGELLELDIDAIGGTIERVLGETAEPVHCLHTDTQGTIWITCDDGLYRLPASKSMQALHKVWEQKPGRLPGGGNHDIFSVSCEGRLFMAGGLTRFWGYPTSEWVFDDLFSYDPDSGFWEVASQLSFPRRYSGIAELNGRVWIVGGEGELGARGGEPTTLDVVEIYDPATGAWSTGPTLQQVRTDPFVMVCDERIWAVGGASDPTTKLQSVESIGTGESVWRAGPDLPQPTRQGGCCVMHGVLYCASEDGFFAFDTALGKWDVDVPQPGTIERAPLVTAYKGEVWMMRGLLSHRTRCYYPGSQTWSSGPDLPTQQSWGAAAVLQGRLYITGGAHRSEKYELTVYDDRAWVLR
jgi:N-acetylneuraminic acid mutarotase